MARKSAPTSQFLAAGVLQGLTQGILQGMQQRQVNEHNDAILKLSMDKLDLERAQLAENKAKGIQDTLEKAVDSRNNAPITLNTIEKVSLYNRIVNSQDTKQGQLNALADVAQMRGVNKQPDQSDSDFLSGIASAIGIKFDAEKAARNGKPLDSADFAEIQNRIAPEILNQQFKAQQSYDQNLINRIDPILKERGEKLEDHFIQFNTNDLKNFHGVQTPDSPTQGQSLPTFLIPKNIKSTPVKQESMESRVVNSPASKLSSAVLKGVGSFFGIKPGDFVETKVQMGQPKEKQKEGGKSGGILSGLSFRSPSEFKEKQKKEPSSVSSAKRLKITPIIK